MWISRKKFKELIRELNSLRIYAEIFDKCLKNAIDETEKPTAPPDMSSENNYDDERRILEEILKSDTKTRTKLCDEMGIAFKTLRNIIDGKPVKPSTREKVRNYIYNKNGSIKNEILSMLNIN